MKITLEKEDLAVLLSKAMGYDITVDDMEVRTDPFEVVIRNVRKNELSEAVEAEEPRAQQTTSTKHAAKESPFIPEEQAQKAIKGLIGINAQLTRSGGGAGPVPPAEAPMFRDPNILGPDESYDPNFDD